MIQVEPASDSHKVRSAHQIAIGKDLLDLVSSAMYVEPLTIFREYVQNAVDAYDSTSQTVGDGSTAERLFEIELEQQNRQLKMTDHGPGIASAKFAKTMLSIGNSGKKESESRGFRGVGRLAGLAYARQLTFRSKAEGESTISEITWDSRILRSALSSDAFDGDLTDTIHHVTKFMQTECDSAEAPFFQVEMTGVVRLRGDPLLSEDAITNYLAQHAPVPFHPDFPFGNEVVESCGPADSHKQLHIRVGGSDKSIYRPHGVGFSAGKDKFVEFEGIEFIELIDVDGNVGAIGWLLKHEYHGAIPTSNLIKGLRFRVGNIQIGDERTLEHLFTEPRFNSWVIGELHILDHRIRPNGRRDDFETNVHYANMTNQLAPHLRTIAKRCRESSIARNRKRAVEISLGKLGERVTEFATESASSMVTQKMISEFELAKSAISKDINVANLPDEQRAVSLKALHELEHRFVALITTTNRTSSRIDCVLNKLETETIAEAVRLLRKIEDAHPDVEHVASQLMALLDDLR